MALSEEQIHRYSRQILLTSVGGVGQERLLHASAVVEGTGDALSDAAAFLDAGGTPVIRSPQTSPGAEEAPVRSSSTFAHSLSLNSDSAPPGSIAQWPAAPRGDGPWVWLRGPLIIGRAACGCRGCFEATVERHARLAEALHVELNGLLGATAALIYQRLILRLGDPVVALQVQPTGAWEPLSIVRCSAHGAD
ncbi:MAG: hypothetical protein ACT4TC_26470 [Myxococcaceae bacterium]